MMIRKIAKSKFFYPTVGLIIAAIGLLWGQGSLLRPKISISCGAINYDIPLQYRMEIMTWKMMQSPEELWKKFLEKISVLLREHGFSEDKIKLLVSMIEKGNKQASSSKADWKPYEQNIIKYVISRVNAELTPAFLQKFMELPDGALFFEIYNTGWVSANNPHIVIRLAGSVYKKPLVESENKLSSSVTEGSELSFDFDRIAPGSKTKGIIWYSNMKPVESLKDREINREINEISVSFDRGTVRKQFQENSILMSSSKEK
jgi:hypothetical protein